MAMRRFYGCTQCSSNDHEFKDCPQVQCRRCKNFGHIYLECPLGKVCSNCNQTGHIFKWCSQIKCRRCQKKGHIAVECNLEFGLAKGKEKIQEPQIENSRTNQEIGLQDQGLR